MRCSTLTKTAIAISAILCGSGCMLAPYNGQVVNSTTSVVDFGGYHLIAGEPVSIFAYNPSTDSWEEIGFTFSDQVSYLTSMDGMALYAWGTEIVIPARFWEPGLRGHRAAVRAASGTTDLMSVESHWLEHYAASQSLTEFAERGPAPESPIARIYTPDYEGEYTPPAISPHSPPPLPGIY